MKSALGRPRSEQAKANILEATFQLLREVGFERLTIDAVAAKAAVGKATIYRWYKNKEDLVIDALTRTAPNASIPNEGSLAADMEALITQSLETDPMRLNRQACALTISALAGSSKLAEIYWTQHIKPRRSALQLIFIRAKERGELAKDADPDAFFDILHGTLLYTVLVKPESSNLPLATRNMVEQLLRGFGP